MPTTMTTKTCPDCCGPKDTDISEQPTRGLHATSHTERRAQAERLMQDAAAKAEAIYDRKIEWHFANRTTTR